MSKYLTIILILVFATTQIKAEDDLYFKADSLMQTGNYRDALINYYQFIKSEEEKTGRDNLRIGTSFEYIGSCYYSLGEYRRAIESTDSALEVYKKFGGLDDIATCYNSKGFYLRKLGKYDEAFSCYNKALQLYNEQGNDFDKAVTLNNIGMLYQLWAKYDTAIQYYQNSMEIKKKLNDSAGIAKTLNNIGRIYILWDDYGSAIEYFEDALVIDYLLGNDKEIAIRYNNLGHAYFEKNKIDRALIYYNEALKISESSGYTDLSATLYNNIGKIYLDQKDYIKTSEYFQKAFEIYSLANQKDNAAQVLTNLADMNVKIGNYNQALTYLSQSMDITVELNLRDLTKTNYETFSEVYAAMGNFSEALRYYKNYAELKDSIFNSEKRNQLTKFQVSYETEKKDIEIDLLTKNKEILTLQHKRDKILRATLIGGFILFFLLAIVIIYSLRQRVRDHRIIASEKAKSDKLLLNILPIGIANDLKEKGKTEPQLYENVSVLFTDIVGFTEKSAAMEPQFLINELNDIFTGFDSIIENHSSERIKTIGDAYMAVCGLPEENPNHAQNIVRVAVEMIQYLAKRNLEAKIEWKIRIGINSGEVMAGVVGVKKYIYDVFGDTVNTASRVECNSEPMKINVSESTYNLLKNKFRFEERGAIDVKGKGSMKMYYLKTE